MMKQDYTEVSKEILEYLFDAYLRDGGTKTYKLREVILGHGFSLTEIGNHLVRYRWIKNFEFRPNEFTAAISIEGIKKIKPNWLDSQFLKISGNLILNGNEKTSLMEIIEYEQKEYQIAEDIAKAFEDIGFVEIEKKEGDILVLLNSSGLQHYSGKNLNNFL